MAVQSWVKDLMVPISEYATIGLDRTLADALQALVESQAHVKEGRQPHRTVLVQRSDGVFVGKLGYHEILGALRPEQMSFALDDVMRRAGVSQDMVNTSIASLEFLSQELPDLCDRACHMKIKNLLLQRPNTIGVNASLDDLIERFVNHTETALLAVDGDDVLGVVRISDLFDEVVRTALGTDEKTCDDISEDQAE